MSAIINGTQFACEYYIYKFFVNGWDVQKHIVAMKNPGIKEGKKLVFK
jgi:hypothetical protein